MDATNKQQHDTDFPSERYNPHAIEKRWQAQWQADKLYEIDLHSDKPKYYFLTMYPYPSGDLHAGHWYAEAPADAAARYRRMRGYNVFFPMGFDAFGLPAENAAVKAARDGKSVHPARLTYERIAAMEKQFAQMGAMFDWSKKVVTCDPEYYKWNQWFFVQMFKRGLAYRKASLVNWDPVDQTVLANEQVINGRGDRSGALVERRMMQQWHFKITDYADELLDFSNLDWPERVKTMQTNWIGRSEGAQVMFHTEAGEVLEVFTTRPDTLWGATFMVLAPEHPLVARLTTPECQAAVDAYVAKAAAMSDIDRQAEGKEKTGEFIGAYAVNPVNGQQIPIWIADYVLMGYGTGAIMAVPAHDERDFAFARRFGLEIVPVIQDPEAAPFDGDSMAEAYVGDGVMINSGTFDGMASGKQGNAEGIRKVIAYLQERGIGEAKVTYRLRDWLISRQRYWGTPIPIVYCDDCGVVPVSEADLPVLLPADVEFMPTGQSPLTTHEAFLHCSCPTCGGAARRETDTMDTFVDSSWYWFRYLSPQLDSAPFDRELADKWMPVEQYTGGIEHAILHLLYSRFFTKVMRDLELTSVSEPFVSLRNQGMILGEDGEKMSKSRGNVVNPDDLVAEYGADAVRTYLMFIGPWGDGGPWDSRAIEGIVRFLNRVWNLILDAPKAEPSDDHARKDLRRAVHHAIKEVSEDLENFQFNTAIAELMTLSNSMSKLKSSALLSTPEWDEACRMLITLLAPLAPHISEELWQRRGQSNSVHLQPWPEYDPEALVQDSVTLAVQVNGKVRAEIAVAVDADKATILETAKAVPNVAKYLENAQLKREIVVPGRLVNLVVA